MQSLPVVRVASLAAATVSSSLPSNPGLSFGGPQIAVPSR